jgi:hypothetical protein
MCSDRESRDRAPGQVVRLGRLAQRVADRAWLDACFCRFQFEDAVKILAPVNYYGDITALARQAGASPTRKNWVPGTCDRQQRLGLRLLWTGE